MLAGNPVVVAKLIKEEEALIKTTIHEITAQVSHWIIYFEIAMVVNATQVSQLLMSYEITMMVKVARVTGPGKGWR